MSFIDYVQAEKRLSKQRTTMTSKFLHTKEVMRKVVYHLITNRLGVTLNNNQLAQRKGGLNP